MKTCVKCYRELSDDEAIEWNFSNGYVDYICPECYDIMDEYEKTES